MKSIEYKNFEQFFLNLVIDSVNRRFYVYERWKSAKQKSNQKVFVFKIYLKDLENYLSKFFENYRVNFFLAKLKFEFKKKILSTNTMSNNRKEILVVAIMQKNTLKRTRKNDAIKLNNHQQKLKDKDFSHKQRDLFKKSEFSNRKNNGNFFKRTRTNIKRSRKKINNKKSQCYDCGEYNYYKFNCFNKHKWEQFNIVVAVKFENSKKKQISLSFRKRSKKNQ